MHQTASEYLLKYLKCNAKFWHYKYGTASTFIINEHVDQDCKAGAIIPWFTEIIKATGYRVGCVGNPRHLWHWFGLSNTFSPDQVLGVFRRGTPRWIQTSHAVIRAKNPWKNKTNISNTKRTIQPLKLIALGMHQFTSACLLFASLCIISPKVGTKHLFVSSIFTVASLSMFGVSHVKSD